MAQQNIYAFPVDFGNALVDSRHNNTSIKRIKREATMTYGMYEERPEEREGDDEFDVCSECGSLLLDAGDGYDGMCADCADREDYYDGSSHEGGHQ